MNVGKYLPFLWTGFRMWTLHSFPKVANDLNWGNGGQTHCSLKMSRCVASGLGETRACGAGEDRVVDAWAWVRTAGDSDRHISQNCWWQWPRFPWAFLCSGPEPKRPLCTSPRHLPELNASLIPFYRWGGGGLCIPEPVSGTGPGAGAVSDLSRSPAPCPWARLRKWGPHSVNVDFKDEVITSTLESCCNH